MTPSGAAELHILRRCLQQIDKAGNLDDECKDELTRLVLERILRLRPNRGRWLPAEHSPPPLMAGPPTDSAVHH